MNIRSREELIQFVEKGNKVKYLFFWGHKNDGKRLSKNCLSQWYESPFEDEGNCFLTAAHHMMYQKAVLFKDARAAQRLLSAKSPGEAKAIGREVHNFDQKVWELHRFDSVVSTNIAKFGSDIHLRKFLLGTGTRVLVEASPVDKIWGVGLVQDDPTCQNPRLWKGSNLLGFALMVARDQLSI